MIEIKNLDFEYEDGTMALQDVNLTIKKGEKIAIMGPNGSGKSTLFLCLNGVRKPTKGSILVKGEPIIYNRKGLKQLRQKIGIVFQNPDNQLFSADVFQEISFGPMNLGLDKEVVRERVEDVMSSLHIEHLRKRPTHFLSGGQKKQVAIADILAMNPEVILFDEPTAALDSYHSRIVSKLIDELCESGITVIQATHDSDYAMAWADQIVVISDGKLLAKDTPQNIFGNVELRTKAYIEEPNVMKVYHSLCEANVIDELKECPRSIEALVGEVETIFYM
ncbi:energy-coupling factor ABC transporter ATP-binding protein [Anaerosporobacter sp.]|uniref:energy-coupling factor ABC transporter ATP-binding protein n=1 Tax=Anaerosporobacter sp. TaxID=1872529 RepID=UPI00286F93BE|nr:ABC transporter ATP-binding protein [Anaerosporobacter sp.]